MFNSGILCEASQSVIKTEIASIAELAKQNTDTLESIVLEYNDQIHSIWLKDKINYYRALTEDSIGSVPSIIIQEGLLSSLKEKVQNVIDAIINFIHKIISFLKGDKNTSTFNNYDKKYQYTNGFKIEWDQKEWDEWWTDYEKRYKEAEERFKKAYDKWNDVYQRATKKAQNECQDFDNVRSTFKFFSIPNLDDIDEQFVRSSITNITGFIDDICANGKDIEPDENYLATAFKGLGKAAKKSATRSTFSGSINSEAEFKKYVTSDIIYTYTKECTYGEFRASQPKNQMRNFPSQAAAKINPITNDLESCKQKVKNSNANLTQEQVKHVNVFLSYIKTIVDCWTWYINLVISETSKQVKNTTQTYEDMKKKAYKKSAAEATNSSSANTDSSQNSSNTSNTNYTSKQESSIWFDLPLTEDAYIDIIQEGLTSSIKETVQKIIDEILNCIHKLTDFFKGEKSTAVTNSYDKKQQETNGFQIQGAEKITGKFTFFSIPNMDKINDKIPVDIVKEHVESINNICSGNLTYKDKPQTAEYYDDNGKADFIALMKSIKQLSSRSANGDTTTADADGFKKYVKTCIVYRYDKECSYEEYRNTQLTKQTKNFASQIQSKTTAIENVLKECRRKVEQIGSELGPNDTKIININLNSIKSITDNWIWFITYIANEQLAQCTYAQQTYERIKKEIEGKNNSSNTSSAPKQESSTIHGEPFNSDTLFDNEDMRDFNPTEWLDLQLTTEGYALKFELDEFFNNLALNEALIITDDQPNKIARLKAMKEAQEGKLGNSIQEIFKRIQQFVNQFFEKLQSKHKISAEFIARNMDAINKPINPENKYDSKGDILAGMYRVQDRIQLAKFDYNTMKDELSDKNAFFQKYIAPSMNKESQYSKRKLDRSNKDQSIADFCKAYYGASMPEDKYPMCSFTGQEMETNKKNIISFLQRANSFLASIKDDLKNLEAEAKKQSSSTPSSNTTQNTNQLNSGNGSENASGTATNANQESYYSVLYGSYITEINIDTGNQNQGDGENGNNSNNNESAAFKAYMDCYKTVILSKLTAAEFVISELSQVIRKHAMSNMSNEQKAKENEIDQKNKAANGPQQQNTEQK